MIGRAQQMMLEYALGQANDGKISAAAMFDPATWLENPATQMWAQQSSKMWDQGVAFWTSLATLKSDGPAPRTGATTAVFADPEWNANSRCSS